MAQGDCWDDLSVSIEPGDSRRHKKMSFQMKCSSSRPVFSPCFRCVRLIGFNFVIPCDIFDETSLRRWGYYKGSQGQYSVSKYLRHTQGRAIVQYSFCRSSDVVFTVMDEYQGLLWNVHSVTIAVLRKQLNCKSAVIGS